MKLPLKQKLVELKGWLSPSQKLEVSVMAVCVLWFAHYWKKKTINNIKNNNFKYTKFAMITNFALPLSSKPITQ